MSELIFKTKTGSHLFGTNTPSSDIDIKGVFIPSYDEILKPRTMSHINLSTGDDKSKNTADDIDEEYYAVHKFLEMLSKGDMVATEMLFAKNEFENEKWNSIFENRDKFLSRECKGFVGYVQRQANTYSVKGDRLNEVAAMIEFLKQIQGDYTKLNEVPDFRLTFQRFCENLEFGKEKNHTKWELVNVNGKHVYHLICCDRKVPDTVTFKTAIDVYQKVLDEYGNRARMAAQSNGHDWKALSHAVRVGEEAIELLQTGNITFPRPNADYLLDIKLGKVSYSEVSEKLDVLLNSVEENVKNSILPEYPNHKFMQTFCINLYGLKVVNEFEER